MPVTTKREISTNTLEWIGNGTIDGGKVFYSQCKVNGILIKCEDDVVILGRTGRRSIAHVQKLYEIEESKDPNRAIVQWYYTYGEISELKGKKPADIPKSWTELLLPSEDCCSSKDDHIKAEDIRRKCNVLKLKPQDEVPDYLQSSYRDGLYYIRFKFDQNYNLYPVNKRLSRKSTSNTEQTIERGINHVRTPKQTPRKPNNTAKTPKAKKTPAKEKVADNSTSKTNKKTPRSTKKLTIKKKCMVSIEPLIFDRDTGTSLKRRASRSVPDESAVTPKRTKDSNSTRKTKEQVMSPRQRYGTAEVLEQVLESESRCSDDQDDDDDDDNDDNVSDDDDDDDVFHPSDVSDLSDGNDGDDDDDEDNDWVVEKIGKARTQGKCTPIRILRSSSKGKSSFTAIQDTSKGDTNYVDIKTISVPLLL